MRKVGLIIAAVLSTLGVSWAAFASPAPPSAVRSSPSPTVTVTVPGGGGTTTTQPSGGGGGDSGFYWGKMNVNPGWCNVSGESAWRDGVVAYQIPSYDPTGQGSQTYYTQVLYSSDGLQVGYYQWCGDTAPKPPPILTGADAIAAAQASGDLASAFTTDPSAKGLTGLEMNLDATTTSAGTVTASNALFSMTATLTPETYYWKMGDDGEAWGQNTTYMFEKSGTHTITLTVRWRVDYTVTGPGGALSTGIEYLSTDNSRDYPVVEAYGVLVNEP